MAGPPLATLILAHGAGADQRSAFMTSFARGLAARGLATVTFNFLYTEQRRRLPDRRPVLDACYRAVIEDVQRGIAGAGPLFIGGKSMGGRIGTHVMASENGSGDPGVAVSGLVLLGYPLHPLGRPSERRDAHLVDVHRPMLFVQGSRDAFGTPSELAPVLSRLSPPGDMHVAEGGDHSFKVTRATGDQARVYDEIQDTIARWIASVAAGCV